jgi:hypothetical protein
MPGEWLGFKRIVSGNDHNSLVLPRDVCPREKIPPAQNAAIKKKGEGVNEKTKKSDDGAEIMMFWTVKSRLTIQAYARPPPTLNRHSL